MSVKFGNRNLKEVTPQPISFFLTLLKYEIIINFHNTCMISGIFNAYGAGLKFVFPVPREKKVMAVVNKEIIKRSVNRVDGLFDRLDQLEMIRYLYFIDKLP